MIRTVIGQRLAGRNCPYVMIDGASLVRHYALTENPFRAQRAKVKVTCSTDVFS